MANDITVTFNRDPGAAVSYTASFTVNSGTPATILLPSTPAGDGSGYSTSYNALSPPPPPLKPSDSVVVSVLSTDASGNNSPPITASGSPVLVPGGPPTGLTGPTNVSAVYVP